MDRRRRAGEWFRRFVSRNDRDGFDTPSPEPSHERTMIAEESRRDVRRMLRTLPARYRDALLLSASGDHTFEEIGRLLGVPTGTAKWRAMEGRRLLKRKLVSRGLGSAGLASEGTTGAGS
jgi:DNA-directed RNA polymerase specialized sigma24 family protein